MLALQVALLGALATRFEELYRMIVSGPWDAERAAVIGLTIVYSLLLTAVIVLAALVYLPMNEKNRPVAYLLRGHRDHGVGRVSVGGADHRATI